MLSRLIRRLASIRTERTNVVTSSPLNVNQNTRDILSGVADLPYFAGLEQAGRDGRVLHRQDIYSSGPPVDDVHGEMLDYLLQHAGHSVLDIGCGLAPYVGALLSRGFRAEGIENDLALVTAAQALGRPVRFMDGRWLEYPDDDFDTSVLIEVVEHIDDYETVLREAFRVARHNVIVSVPNIGPIPFMSVHHVVPWHLLESTHINFFTPLILENLLRRLFPASKVQVEGYSRIKVNGLDIDYQIRALVLKT